MEVFCKDLSLATFQDDLKFYIKYITVIMSKIQALQDLQIFYSPHEQTIIFFKFKIIFY
jgi:hypothetical protein